MTDLFIFLKDNAAPVIPVNLASLI